VPRVETLGYYALPLQGGWVVWDIPPPRAEALGCNTPPLQGGFFPLAGGKKLCRYYCPKGGGDINRVYTVDGMKLYFANLALLCVFAVKFSFFF